jgi:hypothetical protein
MRSIFGWDLPPGCTHRMIEAQCEEGPCDVCGKFPDDCICPECPQCQEIGYIRCYREHGLVITVDQIKGQRERMLEEMVENDRWEAYANEIESGE